ncbi:hypothetical protein L218DRAFT_831842, partial [Marasmius fiardii PR-910]
ALWRHPDTLAKLQHRHNRMPGLLGQYKILENGVEVYDDFFCSSEYLDLIKSGQVGDNDIFISLSMDGAQL